MAIYIWHNKQTKEDKTYECSLHEIESFLDTVPDPDNWYRVIQSTGLVIRVRRRY